MAHAKGQVVITAAGSACWRADCCAGARFVRWRSCECGSSRSSGTSTRRWRSRTGGRSRAARWLPDLAQRDDRDDEPLETDRRIRQVDRGSWRVSLWRAEAYTWRSVRPRSRSISISKSRSRSISKSRSRSRSRSRSISISKSRSISISKSRSRSKSKSRSRSIANRRRSNSGFGRRYLTRMKRSTATSSPSR